MSNSSGDTTLNIQLSQFDHQHLVFLSHQFSVQLSAFRFLDAVLILVVSKPFSMVAEKDYSKLTISLFPFLTRVFPKYHFQSWLRVTVCPPALYFHSEYIMEMTRQTTKLINLCVKFCQAGFCVDPKEVFILLTSYSETSGHCWNPLCHYEVFELLATQCDS